MSISKSVRFIVAWLFALAIVQVAAGQIPDKFTNLKVLPKDISKQDLMDTMKGFTRALDMRCDDCHAGDPTKGFAGIDFPSDEKQNKKTARLMMQMVHEINTNYIDKVEGDPGPRVKVECITCHHGQNRPRMLADVLDDVLQRDGLDSAIARYHELRDEYYGSFTYDFTAEPLNEVAMGQSEAGNYDNAITLLKLNLEMNPESPFVMYQLGEAYAASGDTAKAIEQLETCEKIRPDRRLTRRLNELKGVQEAPPSHER